MNTTEICPGVIHIEESYRVYCTLVQGAALSLLVDTGLGKHSLSRTRRRIRLRHTLF